MSASVLLLCSALCTVAGGALGAAWRRAETRPTKIRTLDMSVPSECPLCMGDGSRQAPFDGYCPADWSHPLISYAHEARVQRIRNALPTHELPMSCQVGSRPSESVRREGPTVARTLEDLMRGEP